MAHSKFYQEAKKLSNELNKLHKQLPKEREAHYSQLITVLALLTGDFTGEIITGLAPTAAKLVSKFGTTKLINLFAKKDTSSPTKKQSDDKNNFNKHLLAILAAYKAHNAHPVEKAIANACLDFIQKIGENGALTELVMKGETYWPNIESVLESFIIPVVAQGLNSKLDTQLGKSSISSSNDTLFDVVQAGLKIAIPLCSVTDDKDLQDGIKSLNKMVISRILTANIKNERDKKVIHTLINHVIDNILLSKDLPAAQKVALIKSFEQIFHYFVDVAQNPEQPLDKAKLKALFYNDDNTPNQHLIKAIEIMLASSVPALREYINYSPAAAIENALTCLKQHPESFIKLELEHLKSVEGMEPALLSALDILITTQQQMVKESQHKAQAEQQYKKEALNYQATVNKALTGINMDKINYVLNNRLTTSNNDYNKNADFLKEEYKAIIQQLNHIKSSKDISQQQKNTLLTSVVTDIESLKQFVEANGKKGFTAKQSAIAAENLKDKKDFRLFFERHVGVDLLLHDFGDRAKGGARLSSIDKEFGLAKGLSKLINDIKLVQKVLTSPQPSQQLFTNKSKSKDRTDKATQVQELLSAYKQSLQKSQSARRSKPAAIKQAKPKQTSPSANQSNTTAKPSLLTRIVHRIRNTIRKLAGKKPKNLAITSMHTKQSNAYRQQSRRFSSQGPVVSTGLYKQTKKVSDKADANTLNSSNRMTH